jgi:hypothetical protein
MNLFISIIAVIASIFVLFKYFLSNVIPNIKKLITLLLNGKKTLGEIISVDQEKGLEGAVIFRASIKFLDNHGKEFSFLTQFQFMAKPPIGSNLRIIYDPENPEEASIYNLGTFLYPILNLFLLIFGCFLIIMAILKFEF